MNSPESLRIPRSAIAIFAIGALVRIAMLLLPHRDVAMYRLPDDALYYFTIARQFALGHGISFDGVLPTNGFHPLWLFVMLPVAYLKLAPWEFINVVLTLQTLLDILNVWLVVRLVLQQIDAVEIRTRSIAVGLGVASYALNAAVIVRGINGLETTIASFLLLLWLSLYCSLYRDGLSARLFTFKGNSNRRALIWFGLISGLLFLARTDFAVIELVAIIVLVLLHRRELVRVWRAAVFSLVLALTVVMPWLIWNQATFGSIVQVSANAVPFFAMKKLDAIYPNGGKALYLIREAARNLLKPFFFTAFGVSLLAIMLPLVLKKRNEFMARLSGSGLLPPLFGALVLILYHSIFRGFIRDWYVLQLLPIVSVVFGAAIAYWLEGEKRMRQWRVGLLLATTFGIALLGWQEYRTPRYASQAVMLETAEFMNNGEHGARFGAFNSGYLSFFAPRNHVQNLDGVVNPTIYPYLIHGTIHQYLEREKIDYILDFPGTINGYQGLIDEKLTDNFLNMNRFGDSVSRDTLELLMNTRVSF